jgi:hypothetical protein
MQDGEYCIFSSSDAGDTGETGRLSSTDVDKACDAKRGSGDGVRSGVRGHCCCCLGPLRSYSQSWAMRSGAEREEWSVKLGIIHVVDDRQPTDEPNLCFFCRLNRSPSSFSGKRPIQFLLSVGLSSLKDSSKGMRASLLRLLPTPKPVPLSSIPPNKLRLPPKEPPRMKNDPDATPNAILAAAQDNVPLNLRVFKFVLPRRRFEGVKAEHRDIVREPLLQFICVFSSGKLLTLAAES